jgi:hypothetical protein
VVGSSGRFSEDLDFTLASDQPEDDVLLRLVEVFNRTHHRSVLTRREVLELVSDSKAVGQPPALAAQMGSNDGHDCLRTRQGVGRLIVAVHAGRHAVRERVRIARGNVVGVEWNRFLLDGDELG